LLLFYKKRNDFIIALKKSAADQTRTDDPLVNSQISSVAKYHATNLLYHAELQRRTIEQNQAQNKCLLQFFSYVIDVPHTYLTYNFYNFSRG
jgi:hypothetical protein